MIYQFRLWAVSVLLEWCLNLTPADRQCANLIQCWVLAAMALREIK